MSSEVVLFDRVSKEYNLSHGIGAFKGFLDKIKNGQIGKRLEEPRVIKALDEVSFSISSGERVGIIGHNGAGKSTMLKLIGRVAYPTRGRVAVRGKTGGVLELGAGFHPELTARENIYFTAVLYGYSKKSVDGYFDEIASIAELGEFVDTPIKKFSSGMKMKLAFALAMITKPDIVLLDEAFAVGDARFKEKSTKMMKSFLEGRTLVLVSHSIGQIREVCERVIVLDGGKLAYDGPCAAGCDLYEQRMAAAPTSAKKIVIAPNVKRGQPEAAKARIKSVAEASRTDRELLLKVEVGEIECKERITIKYSLKKRALGQILDIVDSGERSVQCQSGASITAVIELDVSMLYPGSFIASFEAHSDLAGKMTAVDKMELPIEIEGEGAGGMIRAFGKVEVANLI
jgi:ABC-type polysaccharide/polyol phosphate transport system ATPase subunit